MKDVAGNPLSLGCRVVFTTEGSRTLRTGTVVTLHAKSVELRCDKLKEHTHRGYRAVAVVQ